MKSKLILCFLVGCLFTWILCGLPNIIQLYKNVVVYDAINEAWGNGWVEGYNTVMHNKYEIDRDIIK